MAMELEFQQAILNQTEVALSVTKRLLSTEAKDANCVFCPLSIHIALSLLASGSDGATLDQLLTFLKSKSTQKLASFSSQLFDLVLADGSAAGGPKLTSPSKLLAEQSCRLKASFQNVAEKYYRASTSQVDFIRKSEEARSQANSWVANETDGLIEELLPSGSVNHDTRLIILNALYFKGEWSSGFEVSDTKEHDFHLLNGSSVRVPFMTSKKNRFLYESDDHKVLRLPYNHGDNERTFSMYIMLPHSKDGFPQFVEKMLGKPESLYHQMPTHDVAVGEFRIPKLKMSFDFEASRLLKDMGLTAPFTVGEADFSNMFDSPKTDLIVSGIFHESFIEVNEEGTTAGASTGVVMGTRQATKPIDFVADRPFLFMVKEDRSGSVLFVGQVTDPSRLA